MVWTSEEQSADKAVKTIRQPKEIAIVLIQSLANSLRPAVLGSNVCNARLLFSALSPIVEDRIRRYICFLRIWQIISSNSLNLFRGVMKTVNTSQELLPILYDNKESPSEPKIK